MRVYGTCQFPWKNEILNRLVSHRKNKYLFDNETTDFSQGDTLVMEMGKPLLPPMIWKQQMRKEEERDCFGTYFTSRDVQDLITVAHNYAHNTPSPILLASFDSEELEKDIVKSEESDSSKPHNYITRMNGDGKGTIFFADQDMAQVCMDHYEERFCTTDIALKVNCDAIRELVRIPTLSCSLEEWKKNYDVDSDSNDRINATYALDQCYEKARAERKKNRKKSIVK